MTRVLGALAALAGMTAFACHFAIPVELGDGSSIMLSEATATYRNVGIGIQVLLLAALGLAVALRPAVGARVLALGAFGLPWLAGSVAELWVDGPTGVERVFAGAVLLGLVAVGAAGLVGVREVRWSAGGLLLGDGIALLVAAGVLWALLGVSWYRVRVTPPGALLDGRFGSLLDMSLDGAQVAWIAAGVVVLGMVVAVAGGGWGRRVAGAIVSGVFAVEMVRRVFLSGERLLSPGDQANAMGRTLSGEPVLGLLVLPLVGMAAGAWFVTTAGDDPVEDLDDDPLEDLDVGDGDDQRLAARNPSDSAAASEA